MEIPPDFQAQLAALRAAYRAQIGPRLAQIEALWTALLVEGAAYDTCEQLLHIVHKLAGSAGGFGYAALGEAAYELELQLLPLVEQRRSPSAAEQDVIDDLIARLPRAQAEDEQPG